MNLELEIIEALSTGEGLSYRQIVESVFDGEFDKAKYSSVQRAVKRLDENNKLSTERINGKVLVRSNKQEPKDWYQRWCQDFEVLFDESRRLGWKFKWSCRWLIALPNGKPQILEPDRLVPTEFQSLEAISYELRDVAARDTTSIYHHHAFDAPMNLAILAMMSFEKPRPPDKFRLAVRDIVRQARAGYEVFLAPSCVGFGTDGTPELLPQVKRLVANRRVSWHKSICPPGEFQRLIEDKAAGRVKSTITSPVVQTGDVFDGMPVSTIDIEDLQ